MRHKITVHMKSEEYESFIKGFKSTLYKKISHYARKLILGQPVTTIYRNASLDDLIELGIGLRKDFDHLLSTGNLSTLEREELRKMAQSIQENIIQLVKQCNHISSPKKTF